MAIAKVADRATANANTTVTTVDFALSGLTVGNILIIRTSADNTGGGGSARSVTVTNQSGTPINTSSVQQFQQNNDPGAASAGVTLNVIVAVITATSGTVRITYGGTVTQAAVVEEWSGIDTTTPIVGTPVGANGVNSTNLASVTDASVAANNLAYAAIAVEGPSGDTYTQDSDTTNGSWSSLTKLGTTNATADANHTIYGGYKVVTGSGGQTYNPTINNARDSAGLILEFAEAVEVTAIGAEINPRWSVRTALGDTVEARWSVRTNISDELDVRWEILTGQTPGYAIGYTNGYAPAGTGYQMGYLGGYGPPTDLTAVGNEFEARWSNLATVAKNTDLAWDVREALADTLEFIWNVEALGQASKALVVRWAVKTAVGQAINARWAVRTNAFDTLNPRWAVRTAAGDQVDLRWQIFVVSGATDSLNLRWAVRTNAFDTINPRWAVKTKASDQVDLRWRLKALALRELELQWRLMGSVAGWPYIVEISLLDQLVTIDELVEMHDFQEGLERITAISELSEYHDLDDEFALLTTADHVARL